MWTNISRPEPDDEPSHLAFDTQHSHAAQTHAQPSGAGDTAPLRPLTDSPTESALPMAAQRFDARTMLDHLSIPLLMADAKGRLLYVNPAFSRMFELNLPNKLVNQPLSKLVEVIQARFADPDHLLRVIEQDQPRLREELALTNGRVLELEFEPIYASKDQALVGTMWLLYDVTERRQATVDAWMATERYRAIIETIEDGYYEFDRNGVFTFVNEGLARIVDYSREEMIGMSFAHVSNPDMIERNRALFRQVWETQETLRSTEAPVLRRDGTPRTVEMSVGLIRTAEGEPIGFRGIVRDITERKQMEAALRRRMNLLTILQQVNADLNQTLDKNVMLSVAMSAAVVLADADVGCIMLVENGMMRVVRTLGYDPDLLGLDQTYPLEMGITGRAMRLRQPQLVLNTADDPDYYPVQPDIQATVAVPLISHDILIGALVLETTNASNFDPEVVDLIQVLTARIVAAWDNVHLYELTRKQLDELKVLNSQLTKVEELKTDMIHIASHNLRNPIGIAAGYLGILRDDLEAQLTPAQAGYFDAIERSLQRMLRMTSDILSMEAVQRRMEAPPREIMDLRAMMRNLIDDIEREAQRHRHELRVSLPSIPVLVMADPSNLPEAIMNLLTNAVKYTPDGGNIDVRVRVDGSRVSIEVEDNGYGVPQDKQDRLFQPFYRAKSDETAHIEGTGLGLYLVKKIVEQHGGQMRFRSQRGVGSMFGFDLPLAEAPV